MRRIFRNNGLSIVMFGLFFVSWVGQSITGWHVYNNDQQEHGQSQVGYVEYLGTGAFLEATAENWESEFLQMGLYILLTAFLFQKGSSESKDPDGDDQADADSPTARTQPNTPWPARRGGIVYQLYRHSLSAAFLGIFALCFVGHAIGGAKAYSEEQQAHKQPPVSAIQFLGTSQFWFQSLQNWQSEFLSVGAIVVLSIFLREQGSPESKSVTAPHQQTGEG